MGNALLSFRGLTIPDPTAAELPFDWSTADGTFNRIYCNDIEIANPSGPGQIPALEIVEYNNSPTDFSILQINSNVDGPFEIKTVAQPSSVSRNLDITATDQLIMSAGGLIQLETFTTAPIIFGINGTLVWQIDPNGNILPMEQNSLQIGNTTDSVILAVSASNIITENIFNISGGNMNIGNNSGQIFWAFVNDGSFAPDSSNPNPDVGRIDSPVRNFNTNNGVQYVLSPPPSITSNTNTATIGFRVTSPGICEFIVQTNSGPMVILGGIPFS
jgi:hypothetical protein